MSSTAPPAVAGGGNATPHHRHRALQELRRRVAGTLYTAEDPGWDAARTPWALCVEQTPLAVLEVRDAADVQAAVR
jgi:hypothetical protein